MSPVREKIQDNIILGETVLIACSDSNCDKPTEDYIDPDRQTSDRGRLIKLATNLPAGEAKKIAHQHLELHKEDPDEPTVTIFRFRSIVNYRGDSEAINVNRALDQALT